MRRRILRALDGTLRCALALLIAAVLMVPTLAFLLGAAWLLMQIGLPMPFAAVGATFAFVFTLQLFFD